MLFRSSKREGKPSKVFLSENSLNSSEDSLGVLENEGGAYIPVSERKYNFWESEEISEINNFISATIQENPNHDKEVEEFEKDYKDISEYSVNLKETYEEAKERKALPFFSSEEINRIISDKTYCVDRADKIFINQVWEC